jgi:hypothetical protein
MEQSVFILFHLWLKNPFRKAMACPPSSPRVFQLARTGFELLQFDCDFPAGSGGFFVLNLLIYL